MHILERFLKKASKRSIFSRCCSTSPALLYRHTVFYIKYRNKP